VSNSTAADGPILHAALPEDWAAAFAAGDYRVSTRGMSLAEVGFIHASTPEQVEGVVNRFYADLDELVLLTIDVGRLGADVVWEPPADEVDELFPHIYGPLPIEAVSNAAFWRREGDHWSLDDL